LSASVLIFLAPGSSPAEGGGCMPIIIPGGMKGGLMFGKEGIMGRGGWTGACGGG
jgi:hypothetical protein